MQRTGLNDPPPVFRADLLRRALRVWRSVVARFARSQLLAGIERALRMGPPDQFRADHLAARGQLGRNVGGRAAGACAPFTVSGESVGVDQWYSYRKSARERPVRRGRGRALPALRHAG